MTWVGMAGLLTAISAAYVADLRGSRSRIAVFAMLLVLHTLASCAFYLYAESSGSDAHFYYYDPLRYNELYSGFGTGFIMNTVQLLKTNLGGTFFDYFMLFQAIGFWGVVFVYKIYHEIFAEMELFQPGWTYLPLFLPGIHFWTGAIGKDAPVFLGVALSIWSAMRLKSRLIPMGMALALMLVVRPHIALLALIALAISSLLDRRTGFLLKALFVGAVVAGGIVVAGTIQTNHSVDMSNPDSVSTYMESRTSIDESSGADVAMVQANLPVKILSLWFRPFFLDAENAMGYIASLENAVLLLIFGFLAVNQRLIRTAFRKVLYMRYSTILFVLTTVLLGMVNYNVGLGLRQKMMAMPCLLVMLTTLLALKFSRLSQQAPPAEPQWDRPMARPPSAYPGA